MLWNYLGVISLDLLKGKEEFKESNEAEDK